jgi:hypothetical protein
MAGGVDAEIKGMLIGVAKTGSWAVWHGIFELSWIKLLRAAGLNYHRAREVTGQLAAAISEERVLVPKVGHDREGRAGKEERNRRSEEANAGIHRWIKQHGSSCQRSICWDVAYGNDSRVAAHATNKGRTKASIGGTAATATRYQAAAGVERYGVDRGETGGATTTNY